MVFAFTEFTREEAKQTEEQKKGNLYAKLQ